MKDEKQQILHVKGNLWNRVLHLINYLQIQNDTLRVYK